MAKYKSNISNTLLPFGSQSTCALHFPSTSSNHLSRFLLNDDCLVEIFKHLNTVELIALCHFCKHCSKLIKNRILSNHWINIDELYGKFQIQQVFTIFGTDIRNLSVHRRHVQPTEQTDSQQLLNVLTTNCEMGKLQKLDITLNFNDLDSMCITTFAIKLKNILQLIITGSHYNSKHQRLNNDENNNQIEAFLHYTVALNVFKLQMLSISGQFLQKIDLKHLTELSFVQCDKIEPNALIDCADNLICLRQFTWKNTKFIGIESISENIANLCSILGETFRSLNDVSVHMNYNIKYCHWKDESVLNDLQRLPHLEHLSIGLAGACACNNFYTCIEQLKHLKSLAIESPIIEAGGFRLPCTKIIRNYLPNIFSNLTNLIKLRIVHINPRNDNFLNKIIIKLPNIEELHLIGLHKMNEEILISLMQNVIKLKILNLQETRFKFTQNLYEKLVNECQQCNRFIRIIVGEEMKRMLFRCLKDRYRKEFVQIIS